MQFYSDPSRESDPHALPDCETFRITWDGEMQYDDNSTYPLGWYYWYCFPGCLPDGEAIGPFETEQDAIDDARSMA